MSDALANFKPAGGMYLRFNHGDEIKLRVLTLDPIVSESTWESEDGETVVSTKYSFIVYNWTDDRPQILSVGPGLLNKFVRLHQEPDLPALNKMDIKITATGEKLKRRYDVITLPEAQDITRDILSRVKDIDLDENIKDAKGRLSEIEGGDGPDEDIDIQDDEYSDVGKALANPDTGYAKAKRQSEELKNKKNVENVFSNDNDDEEVDLGDL